MTDVVTGPRPGASTDLVGPWLRPIATGASSAVVAGVRELDGRSVMWIEVGSTRLLARTDFDVMSRAVADAASVGLPIMALVTTMAPTLGPEPGPLVGWGGVARALTAASGIVPILFLIDGAVTTGIALLLGLADVVIATDHAIAYVSAPRAVAATSGRSVSPVELGGAAVHGGQSGLASMVVETLEDAVVIAADLVAFLPSNNLSEPPRTQGHDPVDRPTPRLATLVPDDDRLAYDVRDVIEEIVDDGELCELRVGFGRSIVCGLARLDGHTVGVVASQPAHLAGAIDIPSSQKAARFVQWCDAFGIALLTLVDTPGYLPGRDLEWDGMIRHGGQLAFAYAAATVPRLCVIMRKAFGGAYIVMDCATMGNDVCFAWPNSKIAVMGASGAVQILHQRHLAGFSTEDALGERQRLEDDYAALHLSPDDALRRGYVDAVIDPTQTRTALCRALGTLSAKRSVPIARKHHTGPL